MKVNVLVLPFMLSISLFACSYEPHGRWEALQQIKVLAQKNDPVTVLFVLEKGDICAMSDKWYVTDMPYKKISCEKGVGWISNDEHLKKLGD